MILDEIIKRELEFKYKIDFKELENISEILKNKYFINKNINLIDFIIEDDTITFKCIDRHKFIEKREYSYISDLSLYKRIEKAYNLFYVLLDYMNLNVLWNKEINKIYDNDYKFLKRIALIYLIETEEIVKDIEKYELGGINNEEDTNENVCCYKRKI